MTINIREVTFAKPERVDRDAGVIHGVKILGPISDNGRRYTEGAMRQAASFYSGVHVNIDHPADIQDTRPRGFMEQIGTIANPTITEGGVFGDLNILKSHPAADLTFERAERFPESFGLSHDAQGNTAKDGDIDVVEEITAVNSVDIVSSPATNKGLFEHHTPKTEPKKMRKSLKEWLAQKRKTDPVAKAILEMDDPEVEKALDTEVTKEMDEEPPMPPDETIEMDEPEMPPMMEPEADPMAEKAMAVFTSDKTVPEKLAAIKAILISQDKIAVEMAKLDGGADTATEARLTKIEAGQAKILEALSGGPNGAPPKVLPKNTDGNQTEYKSLAEACKSRRR